MIQMKHLLFFFLLPLHLLAQPAAEPDITGAWNGFLNTSEKKLNYEVVISDSAGMLTGFSRIVFTIKGEEYAVIKSLIIKKEKDRYILEEDKLLFDNLQEDAAKTIKQISTLSLETKETMLVLSGSFKTKVEKGMRSASGNINLEKIIEPAPSKLLAELDQLKIAGNLSFIKPAPAKEPIAKAPEPEIPEPTLIAKTTTPAAKVKQPAANKPVDIVSKKTKKVNMKPVPVMAKAPLVKPKPAAPVAAVAKEKKPAPVVAKAAVKAPVAETKPVVIAAAAKPALPKNQLPVGTAGSASDIGNRSIETIQTVYFKSDSLLLTLYDNGEVDGDTVSVLLNGKVLMGKKGLSTNAISQTIYMTPDLGDSLQMIMYAENLGAIAPNTGLLIVQDGRDRYEIRFSGDLSKNAAIIFKRRK